MDAKELLQVFSYIFSIKTIYYLKVKKKLFLTVLLVAITLLLAESKPEEKEIMINVIMNFLDW